MSNSLSANFPEFWSKRIQVVSEKLAVYRKIANFEEAGQLKIGDVVHRPYGTTLIANAVGTDGAYTRQDITMTNEYLTVDQKKEATFYVEDADELQSKYPIAKFWSDRAAVALINKIDGDVLGEYDQADSQLGNYELGGGGSAADGIGFTLTTSNILKVFSKANKALDKLNVAMGDRKAVISPDFRDVLFQFIAGKETALGDSTGKNGHIGKYAGFQLYMSNALGWSGRLEFATNPTEADTITINGVAFNFKATLGEVAGTIHICSDAENTLNSLVAAINTPGTSVDSATDAGFVAVSDANVILLKDIVATDVATYMTLKAEGHGSIAVSETLSAEADIWTLTKQLQHNLFMQGTPTDLVVQKYPNMQMFHRTGYIGKDVVTWTFYGLKTFDEGDRLLVDVQIRSDAF